MKTETYKHYSRAFYIFLPNIIEIYRYYFELYRFKVGRFLDTVYIWFALPCPTRTAEVFVHRAILGELCFGLVVAVGIPFPSVYHTNRGMHKINICLF